ncbi:MAG: GcrA cell cycle regulator [Hydrogenophilaceae bacterium]|jgi:GcrA cell cycle regulator|nr:GcrA cell cycle regulator [Hydrogenophilaceae bacterium]
MTAFLMAGGLIMSFWTDENVALLRKLWGEGRSARDIAARISGATRNSIIGKAHRLGLPSRTPLTRVAPRPKSEKAPRARAPRLPRFVAEAIDAVVVQLAPHGFSDGAVATVLTVKDGMCKYPIGDPKAKDFAYCGRDACRGSYCADHARLAYTSPRRFLAPGRRDLF